MNENITSVLQKKACHIDDKITLWHTSDNYKKLKPFLDRGAETIGRGMGGQSNGFYVWNNKKSAESHFDGFLYKDKSGDGLLIGVTVDKSTLTYPDWQFDLELSKELSPLLFKYKDAITQIKDLEYKDEKGQKQTVKSFSLSRFATEENCLFKISGYGGCTSVCLAIGDDNGTLGVDIWQSLVDKMCEDPQFREDYNKLLQKSVSTSKRLALKYCGKKTLPIDKAIHIQKDEKGKVVETPLYTSSVSKEKQVCPFLKVGMARKKGPVGM